MSGSLMNLFSLCFKPFGHVCDNSEPGSSGGDALGAEGKDGLLWFRDLGKYCGGEFSMAVIQVNQVLEDQSQIEPRNFRTFIGVYDGHGGPEAARYVCDHLFNHFQGFEVKFNKEPIGQKFRLAEAMKRPLMSAIATILSHPQHPNDSFLIFASDGLWEHLSNEKAVEVVHNHPRAGSAKRLIKADLHGAARKREMRYSDLMMIDKKVRRHFHYDITVIVVFLNHDLIYIGHINSTKDSTVSIRSALQHLKHDIVSSYLVAIRTFSA